MISFHNYDRPEQFEAPIAQLRGDGRPLMATEWTARDNGSIVDTILPLGQRARGDVQLGLRAGPHPDQPTIGQLAVALHIPAAADLVPRPFSEPMELRIARARSIPSAR